MLKNNQNPIDLGNILGEKYRNIMLIYKYNNDKLISVYPIVRPL